MGWIIPVIVIILVIVVVIVIKSKNSDSDDDFREIKSFKDKIRDACCLRRK